MMYTVDMSGQKIDIATDFQTNTQFFSKATNPIAFSV